MEQAQQMATSLDNLANASIQKKNHDREPCSHQCCTIQSSTGHPTNARPDDHHRTHCDARNHAQHHTRQHPPPPLPWNDIKPAWDKGGYCWTHGHKVKVGHNSSTCTSRKAGHQAGATRNNTLGGSTFNADRSSQLKVDVNSQLANAINISSGCTNPSNLDATALIDTAASVLLLTPQAPANNAITTDVKITVIQPSGAKMTSNNTVDLLLQALPPDAHLAHGLPSLTNNLLSVAALCNARCEVFFHWHGCKVTLEGTTIIRGWRDPQTDFGA